MSARVDVSIAPNDTRAALRLFHPTGNIVTAEWFESHLAPRSAAALRHATAAARLSLREHVDAVLPGLERLYLHDLMKTADAAEGIRAFLEKRQPNWTDR